LSYGTTCVPVGLGLTTPITTQSVVSESYAAWNDPASADAWSAFWTVLLPTPAPLSTVGTVNAGGASFTMTPVGTNCSAPITVDLDTTSGQATLIYQVNRNSAGVITVTPATDISQFVAGTTLVKVYGVPVAASGNGVLKAYVLFYFTGTAPTQ
jgi:hypothetical protein